MPYSEKADLFESALMANKLHYTEGEAALSSLNKISKDIGYRQEPFRYGSSFERFLQDNSGCVEAIHNWMAEHLSQEQLENLGVNLEPDDEEDDEDVADDNDHEDH